MRWTRTGLLDTTWIIYTSDHGEMGGNHGMMSKCVLYEPAVRVPLIVRPPGGCAPHVVDSLVEHLDVPATLREIAGAPDGGRYPRDVRSWPACATPPRAPTAHVTVSENWGFAAFETERYKLVVDEDALAPCQLFDLSEDAAGGPQPPARSGGRRRWWKRSWRPTSAPSSRRRRPVPIPSFFTGGYDT